MNVLITGITGFAGSHLAEYILAHHPDAEVHGIVRWRSRMDNIAHLAGQDRAPRGRPQGHRLAQEGPGRSRPDRIFHLAAQSFVPTSWSLPGRDVRRSTPSARSTSSRPSSASKLDPRIQIAGSSEEYGHGPSRRGPDEGDQPAPAAQPLRGQQGRPGPPGLPVLQELRPEDRPDARIQPHRAAARRRLRHLEFRQADRRDRERASGRRSSTSATSRPSATSPTSATSSGPTGWPWRRASPARSTTSARARRSP